MEYECIYNSELDTIEAATRGTADKEVLLSVLRRVAALCGQHESANILVDYSRLDAKQITWEDLETLSREMAVIQDAFKRRKCANIVMADYQFGLVRTWEIMIGVKDCMEMETGVFRKRDEAVAWLRAVA